MDVAKRLAQWQEQSPEQWISSANRYLPPVVTAVLVLAIAYQLATLTWAVVPTADSSYVAVATPSSDGTAPARAPGDFGALLSAHLYGKPPQESAPVVQEAVVDAPDTTLSLSLTGILSHDSEGNGEAIISSSRGQERNYRRGDAVENANGATLHSVYADRVLLNRGDHLETLRLPKDPAASVARPVTPMQSPAAANLQNESLRQVLTQNASRLTDVIRLAPHVDQGQVVGFRVNPGRDRATFDALGLQPGDVVTDINGVVLDDASRGLQAFEALGEATMANVTVLRDGVPQVLVIDTSQLQKLGENRE